MTLDSARPEKKNDGGSGGRSPLSGFGFRDPTRRPDLGPPALPGITRPGPRRDMGWVWDWVWGLGNISRILENVGDFDFQYFQDSGECCRPRGPPNNKIWRCLE